MKNLLLATLFVLFSAMSFSQTDTYSEEVKTMIKYNGVYAYYDNVVDEMFDMLKQQYASKNVPEDVWTDMEDVKKLEMDELSQMLVSAYRGYLSQSDVKSLTEMYKTDAGKTMVFDAQNLTDDHRRELSGFYNSETGQTLLAAQPEIDKLMSKISEMWSGSMYKNVVKRLADRGFTLDQ